MILNSEVYSRRTDTLQIWQSDDNVTQKEKSQRQGAQPAFGSPPVIKSGLLTHVVYPIENNYIESHLLHLVSRAGLFDP
jgi:hypothetical protein